MTKEDKELLLKDLCARLPYGVKVNISASAPGTYDNYIPSVNDATLNAIDLNTEKCKFKEFWWDKFVVDVRQYLRPMSSMTEEEKNELYSVMLKKDDGPYFSYYMTIESLDWLNTHHFDYNGLIEKGLAIGVTEKNNPYKDR